MPHLTTWIGPFVLSQISSIVLWARNRDVTHGSDEVKRETDDQYVDDGSNFRYYLDSSHLPAHGRVQLVTVVSTERPVTIWIADGSTQIRARLSDDAHASFENGIDDALSQDLSGDVFDIQDATIIATPYGLAEGYVQIEIASLIYRYHLRKVVGSPTPIHEVPSVSAALSEVRAIRQLQYNSFDDQASSPSASEVDMEISPGPHPRQDHTKTHVTGLPESSQSRHDAGFQSQDEAVTEVLPSRQQSERPVIARPGTSGSSSSGEMRSGRGPHGRPPQAAAGLNHDRPTGRDLKETRNFENDIATSNLARRKIQPQSSVSNTNRTPSREPGPSVRPYASRCESARLPNPTQASDVVELPRRHRNLENTKGLSPEEYGIPQDQQDLLDGNDSWRPALPGRTFPHPNVPTALLNFWNEKADRESMQPLSSHPRIDSSDSDRPELDKQDTGLPTMHRSAKSSSHYVKSRPTNDDEPVDVWDPCSSSSSSCEWSTSPPSALLRKQPRNNLDVRGKDELPPDSSLDSSAESSNERRREGRESNNHLASFPSVPQHTRPAPTTLSRSSQEDRLEEDVPRAFDGSPINSHHQRRSEYFKAAQKRQWIESKFKLYANATDAYVAYQCEFGQDQSTQVDFLRVAEEVFTGIPNIEAVMPMQAGQERQSPREDASMEASDTSEHAGSLAPSDQHEQGDQSTSINVPPAGTSAEAEHTSDGPIEETDRIDDPSPEELPSQTTLEPPVEQVLEPRLISRTLPWASSPRSVDPVSSPNVHIVGCSATLERRIMGGGGIELLNRSRNTNADSVLVPATPLSREATRPHISGVRSSDQPDIEQEHLSEANVRVSTAGNNPGPSSVFGRFFKAYKTSRPGGAFAQSESPQTRQNRMNVLDWHL